MEHRSTPFGQVTTPKSTNYQLTGEHEDFEVQSSTYSHTFRDTELEEVEAVQLRKIQNLASIINDPKSDTFYKQLQKFIIKPNPLDYKPLNESQTPESFSLPKIGVKDFSDYLHTIKDVILLFIR
jgi:hypothetical protein